MRIYRVAVWHFVDSSFIWFFFRSLAARRLCSVQLINVFFFVSFFSGLWVCICWCPPQTACKRNRFFLFFKFRERCGWFGCCFFFFFLLIRCVGFSAKASTIQMYSWTTAIWSHFQFFYLTWNNRSHTQQQKVLAKKLFSREAEPHF